MDKNLSCNPPPALARQPDPTAWFEFECQTETMATSIRILYAELIAAIERDLPNTTTPDLQRLFDLHENIIQEMEVRNERESAARRRVEIGFGTR